MAQPIYDEDRDKDLDALTPEALRQLEDKYSTDQDEAEDNDVEAGADPDELERGGMGRKLRENDEDKEAEKAEALDEKLSNQYRSVVDEDEQVFRQKHEDQVGRGYTKGNPSFWSKFGGANRKWTIGGSVTTVLLIGIFVSMFGFMNVFKLDGIMSNVDAKTFARFNAAASGRSDKWVKAYIQLRLTQLTGDGAVGADGESEYFRANRVDTNSPIRDWYHTLRTSSFESDLAKQGVVFANQEVTGADGKTHIHFVTLEVDGKQIAGLSPGDVRSGKLVNWLNEASPNKDIMAKINIDLSEPGGSKKARAAIKDTTRDLNVIKRRQIRKAIQNETGVKSWRFFETTRDKVSKAKTDIRNKIITTAIPESTKSGKFIRCLFGVSNCVFSDDPVSPANEASSSLTETSANEGQPITESTTDSNGKPVTKVIPVTDLQPAADTVTKITAGILEKANVVLSAANIVSTLDSFSHIDRAMRNGDLSKGIVVARGVQSMGLYQTFETARDQIRTGQVTGPEVNDLMKVIGPVAASDAWAKVVDGNGDPSKLTDTAASRDYCSQKNQDLIANDPVQGNKEFAYQCPDKQIGGGSNATSIEQAYKNTVGAVVGPILAAYNSVRDSPVIGSILNIFEGVVSNITSAITGAILKATGLSGPLDKTMAQVTTKVVAFLGAGPIINGNESAGQMMNWVMQGGAYAAEASARTNGASLTTPQSAATASQVAAQYQTENNAGSSLFDKIASLNNPDSLAAKGLFGLSQLNMSNWSSYLGAGLKNIASVFTRPFNPSALAAGNNLYAGSQFAGIKTYDFPSQCYNLNPITMTPRDGTNIQEIMAKNNIDIPSSDLTWDLVNNSSSWYQYIYGKLGNNANADTIAEQIYNCNLLDTSVRGGLGFLYGYTNDNGLDETTPVGTSSNSSASGSLVWPFATKDSSQYQRVDQGWDIQDKPGVSVYAVAAGTIYQLAPDNGCGFGHDYPTEKLDNSIGGPTNWVYYGHVHVLPGVINQHVSAGQRIAVANTADGSNDCGKTQNGSAAPSGWLEIGFALAGTDAPVDTASEKVATQAGQTMKSILISANPAASQ